MKHLVFNNTLLFQKLFGNEIKAISDSETEIGNAPYQEIFPYSENKDKDLILLVYHDDNNAKENAEDKELTYFDGFVADAFYSLLYDDDHRLIERFTLTELLHILSCSKRTQLTKKRRKMLTDSLNRLRRYEIYIVMRPDDKGNFDKKIRGRLIDFQKISEDEETSSGEKTYYISQNEPVINRYTRALAESKSGSGEQKITAKDYQLGVYQDELRIPGLKFITKTSMMLTRFLWMRLEVEKRRAKECTILVYTKDGEGIVGKLIGKKGWKNLLNNDPQKLYRMIDSVIGIAGKILEYYRRNGYIKRFELVDDEKFIVGFYGENEPVELWKSVTDSYSPNIRIPFLESEMECLDRFLNDPETKMKPENETADRLIKKCEQLIKSLKTVKTADPTLEPSDADKTP